MDRCLALGGPLYIPKESSHVISLGGVTCVGCLDPWVTFTSGVAWSLIALGDASGVCWLHLIEKIGWECVVGCVLFCWMWLEYVFFLGIWIFPLLSEGMDIFWLNCVIIVVVDGLASCFALVWLRHWLLYSFLFWFTVPY